MKNKDLCKVIKSLLYLHNCLVRLVTFTFFQKAELAFLWLRFLQEQDVKNVNPSVTFVTDRLLYSFTFVKASFTFVTLQLYHVEQ